MIFFTATGLFLFFSPFYLAGFISMGFAVMAGQKNTVRSEDILVSFLAVLAFLGIVATIIEDLIGRWLLS